jgi:hypothetical protein
MSFLVLAGVDMGDSNMWIGLVCASWGPQASRQTKSVWHKACTGPMACDSYYGAEKPHVPLGGFSAPDKGRRRRGGRWVGGSSLPFPMPATGSSSAGVPRFSLRARLLQPLKAASRPRPLRSLREVLTRFKD